jgi:hypothetical protein
MENWRIAMMFAIRLSLSAGILWTIYRFLGVIPFLLGVPIAGALLAKPIIEAGGSWLNWARNQPLEQWQGNYYAFANAQIRFFEVDNELWVVASDLLRVINEKPTPILGTTFSLNEYAPIPSTKLYGFSPAGAEKILGKSRHVEAGKMRLWLQREVYKTHKKKRDLLMGM